MTSAAIERNIRAQLPLTRLMQVVVPLSLSNWLIKQGLARVRLPAEVTREAVSADGVPCEWLIPRNCPNDQVLLYLHGGGFVYELTPPHLEMLAYLAHKMSMRVLAVDYRVAPDYPFPAALDDCVTAYRWLLKQGVPADAIVMAGDSAGGNLTITSLMKLRDSGDSLPAAAACLSPVTDLSDKANRPEGFNDPLLHPKAVRKYNISYVGHNDAHNPLISPVFGDWHGLPPLLIHAGEDELLREDAVRIDELARAAGIDVKLEIYPRMWHVWQLYLKLPQAVQSLDEIASFLKSHLKLSTPQPDPS
jgi:epsilon-lactone hydrolase